MARILYAHPGKSPYEFHLYTDLDFWDARRILGDLALVKRNFGKEPDGDEFPTQVVGRGLDGPTKKDIIRRLQKAIPSPPRHVIVSSVVHQGSFEFDPRRYFPERWDKSRMLFFTYHRLPLGQSVLNSPHKTVRLDWVNDRLRLTRIRREQKYDPAVTSRKEAKRRLHGPGCF